jgi:membrane-bound serine protease (ClpP class)
MEFLEIFTEMHWVPALLLILGLIMLIVEIFVSGFGFFGISGIVSLVLGVIVRICFGLNLSQSLTLILLILGFLVLVVMFMVWSSQYGFLSRTGLFERKSTLPNDYNHADQELKHLVGKNGKTISKLDLGGKAKICGKIYDVVSISSYLEPKTSVKVVEIKDNTIMVRKWFD